jgi:hypothetical protein
MALQCSEDTFVLKFATFAKPKNVRGNTKRKETVRNLNIQAMKIANLLITVIILVELSF